METILISSGFTIITGLLGVIYSNLNKKIGEQQPKDVCVEITRSIRTEIQMSNKLIETELLYIKEAVDELRCRK